MTKPLIVLIALTFVVIAGYSQDVKNATIKWSSAHTQIEGNAVQVTEISSLTTHGSNSIEWIERGSTTSKSFQITETMGDWPDVKQEGWLQYEIIDGTTKGTIAIRKYPTETKVFITVISEPLTSYVLTINGYEVL